MSRKILFISIFLGLSLIITGAIYALITYKKIVVKPNKPKNNLAEVQATPTPDPLRPYSILLMGYGGGAHPGGKLTDSMMVARVDPKNQEIKLISIPRDLWVSIPVNQDKEQNFKINAAYAIGSDDKKYPNKKIEFTGTAGGGELSKYVVSKVVGFPIDYFVALDFQGFIKTVDILGGINVKVQKTFDDYMYPIEQDIVDNCGKTDEEVKSLTATMSGDKLEQQFPCRYEHLHFDAGPQTMDGETALKFVRSRHSKEDGGDFNRAARQQLVITSTKDKVISINFIPKIIPFINTLANNMQTDIDFNKTQDILNHTSELNQYKISKLALTDENVLKQGKSSDGQFILIPTSGENQWDTIHQYLADPNSIK